MPIQELPESSKMHAVPQNIMDVEFKLIGDLTMRQFSYLLLCGVIAYVSYLSIGGIFKWPLVIFFVILGLGLAFVPIQERGLDVWLVNMIRAIYSPTQRVWHKEIVVPSAFTYENMNVVKQEMITLAPTSSRRKLEEYLEYKVKKEDVDPLDIPERDYVMKVRKAYEGYVPPPVVSTQGSAFRATPSVSAVPSQPVGLTPTFSPVDDPTPPIRQNTPTISSPPVTPATSPRINTPPNVSPPPIEQATSASKQGKTQSDLIAEEIELVKKGLQKKTLTEDQAVSPVVKEPQSFEQPKPITPLEFKQPKQDDAFFASPKAEPKEPISYEEAKQTLEKMKQGPQPQVGKAGSGIFGRFFGSQKTTFSETEQNKEVAKQEILVGKSEASGDQLPSQFKTEPSVSSIPDRERVSNDTLSKPQGSQTVAKIVQEKQKPVQDKPEPVFQEQSSQTKNTEFTQTQVVQPSASQAPQVPISQSQSTQAPIKPTQDMQPEPVRLPSESVSEPLTVAKPQYVAPQEQRREIIKDIPIKENDFKSQTPQTYSSRPVQPTQPVQPTIQPVVQRQESITPHFRAPTYEPPVYKSGYPAHNFDKASQGEQITLDPMTPDMHSGRRFINLVPSKGELILPIRGERVLKTSEELAVEEQMKTKYDELQTMTASLKSSKQFQQSLKVAVDKFYPDAAIPSSSQNQGESSPSFQQPPQTQNPQISQTEPASPPVLAPQVQPIEHTKLDDYLDSVKNNIALKATQQNDNSHSDLSIPVKQPVINEKEMFTKFQQEEKSIESEIDKFKKQMETSVSQSIPVVLEIPQETKGMSPEKPTEVLTKTPTETPVVSQAMPVTQDDAVTQRFEDKKTTQQDYRESAPAISQTNSDPNTSNKVSNDSDKDVLLKQIANLKAKMSENPPTELPHVQHTAPMGLKQEQQKTVAPHTPSKGHESVLQTLSNEPNVVTGVVVDNVGSIQPGVLILIKNQKGDAVRAMKTNIVGQFIFSTPLPDGNYTIEANNSNIKNLAFDIISINLKGEILPPVEMVGRPK